MNLISHQDLLYHVHIVWLGLAAASWLVKLVPQLDFVSKHGKLNNAGSVQKSRDASASPAPKLTHTHTHALAALTVPKHWFAHLYITGIATALITLILRHIYDSSHDGGLATVTIDKVCLCLFILHCTRRLLECWHISNFGQSRMHMSGYLVGLLHYLLVPMSLSQVSTRAHANIDEHTQLMYFPLSLSLSQVSVILMFFTANYLQHKYHRILSSGTCKHASGRKEKEYIFPTGGLFNHVCCPHYTCEICIYMCFFFLLPQKNAFSLLLWVVSNLSVVAKVNLEWYKNTFPSEMEKQKNWKSCFPYVY